MSNINEHLPLTLIQNVPILCTIILMLTMLIFTKTKIRLSDLFLLGGLTYLMFSSRRQASMFALLGTVVATRMITDCIKIYIDADGKDIFKKLINIFTLSVIVIVMLIWSCSNIKDVGKNYISKKTYPVEAAEWILENLDVNKVKFYNEYNYGSYLLFKGIPVFIDSRADLYAPEFNTETGDKENGRDIFSDFINSSNIGEYYGDIFEKYQITHVILYKNAKIAMLIDKADSEKYKQIYSDDNFVIYEILEY